MIEFDDLPNGLVAWTHTVGGRESYGIASDLEMALLTIEKGKEREDEKIKATPTIYSPRPLAR